MSFTKIHFAATYIKNSIPSYKFLVVKLQLNRYILFSNMENFKYEH